MKTSSPRRPWTKAEKRLLLTPALVGIFALALTVGPGVVRKKLGYPDFELKTAPGVTLTSIALSPDGKQLAATGLGATVPQNGDIWFWDAHTLRLAAHWPGGPRNPNGGWASRQPSQMQWSKDGKKFMFGRTSEPFRAYDVASRKVLWSWGRASFENSIRLSPDGKTLFVPETPRLLKSPADTKAGYALVDASTGKVHCRWKVRGFPSDPTVSFAPDGKTLASIGPRRDAPVSEGAYTDGRDVEIRRVSDAQLLQTLSLPWTLGVEFSPDGSHLLIVSESSRHTGLGTERAQITCVAPGAKTPLWTWKEAHGYSPEQAIWAPDGSMAAVSTNRNQVLLLDASTGQLKRTLRKTSNFLSTSTKSGLSFSPDGKRLFARGKETLLVWDLN